LGTATDIATTSKEIIRFLFYRVKLLPEPPLFCRPEALAEGSLGAYAPREDKVEGDAVPNEVKDAVQNEVRDAVPNEVRDA